MHPLAVGEHFENIEQNIVHYYVAGNGPVMLVPSPGWGPSVNYLMPLSVFEEYFTMVYFDTRHSGQSTGPEDSSAYSLEHFVADIESLRRYLGQSKIFIAGHSGGGHQVLEYGIQYSPYLLGIIAIDAIAAPDERRVQEMTQRILKKKDEPYYLTHKDYYENAAAFMLGKKGDDQPTQLKDVIKMMGAFYFHRPELAEDVFEGMDLNDKVFEYTTKNGFQGKNLLSELKQIAVPTLIIVGDDDFICDPVSQAQRIHENVADSKLVVIRNCGHLPWVEQPADFYQQCEIWFHEQKISKTISQIKQ